MDKEGKKRAWFFDRDGVVNRRIIGGYVRTPQEFELLDGVGESLRLVKDAGYVAIIITNQQGVGKGIMTDNDLQAVHTFMQEQLLELYGVQFDDIMACTDLASKPNNCRKPDPSMLLESAKKWNINVQQSWMIGDSISDCEAGRRAGTHTVLLGDYKECEFADYILSDTKYLPKHIAQQIQ
jgi:D-glycero-D-manno-heptose 1,7-bisphosphate phosphatase